MLPSFARETVTVTRAPLIDRRGTVVRDWANAVTHTISGCNVQPVSSTTAWTDPAQAVTVRCVLRCPPDADIEPTDKITVDGIQYAVDGAPHLWRSPTGAVSHLQCNLIDWME